MCHSISPPAYRRKNLPHCNTGLVTPSTTIGSATPSSSLTTANIERVVEGAVASEQVIDKIAEKVSMRVFDMLEGMFDKMGLSTNASSASSSASRTAGSGEKYYEYRTVTQGEISSVMAALVGVTWKRCPNNHLYAVGECGTPTVSGTCIECKAYLSR
ncbi:hypothetical protein GGF46_004115 [Coemansia sp. RSA 552]|nr:hypothetical protein GGF46_004115 [Coemansia sp. RSA 552]